MDTVALRLSTTVADFWESHTPDLHTERDALSRDVAAAYNSGTLRPHGRGTVHAFTTTRTLASAFLAMLATYAEVEFHADDANTKGARAALALVARQEAKGLPALLPADYRMADPAAQTTLEAEITEHAEHTAHQEAQHADNATHRDAWKALTREERTTRTAAILDAAAATLGMERTDTRPYMTIGHTSITVPDGRLYIEVRRTTDPAAQTTIAAARTALTAAGWTLTDHGTHFYATPPQDTPAPAPAITAEFVWTHREGTRLTGLLNFTADTPAGRAVLATTTNDREPQFLLTGTTRRETLDARNDYDTADQFTPDPGTPKDIATQAAAWLGYTATVNVKIIDEYRQHA